MKTINIQKTSSGQVSKEICLGNGYRKIFDSVRDAKKFKADTNRFLTECLVIVNLTYADMFKEYRLAWLTGSNNRGANIVNNDLFKIKTNLDAAGDMLQKFGHVLSNSNDPFFSFIDLKKASLFLSEAGAIIETINRKRNLTANMYTAGTLKKRCLLIIEKLNSYPL